MRVIQPSTNLQRAKLLTGCVVLGALAFLVPPALTLPPNSSETLRLWPGMEMAASGDWIVPTIFGAPYLNKPPLLYWLISTAFGIAGGPDLFAARLVNIVLAAATALYCGLLLGGRNTRVGLAVAVAYLCSFGTVIQGSWAVIDTLLADSFAAACATLLATELGRMPARRGAVLCGLFLGIGFLAKGPLLWPFFFAAACVVGAPRKPDWKFHGVALAVAVALFSLWAIPLVLRVGIEKPLAMFLGETTVRFTTTYGGKRGLIAETLLYLWPFLLIIPSQLVRFVWKAPAAVQAPARLMAAMLAILFAFVMLPGFQAQYSLPFTAVIAFSAGMVLACGERTMSTKFHLAACFVLPLTALIITGRHMHAATVNWWAAALVPLCAGIIAVILWQQAGRARLPLLGALSNAAGLVLLQVVLIAPHSATPENVGRLAAVIPPRADIILPSGLDVLFERPLFYLADRDLRIRRATQPSCDGSLHFISSGELDQMRSCARVLTAIRLETTQYETLQIATGWRDPRAEQSYLLVSTTAQADLRAN